ncbi:MAG: hypothetical protein HKN77_06820, partial [Woeseiaceae bacterium]|nr:hypothetical protein [Woeseiaceae bacterium]
MTKPTALLFALLLSTAGCVTTKSLELPDLSEWDQRRAVLAEIDQYDFNGRIAVKAGDDG